MSAGLYEEWQESIQRLAQHLVTQAEPPTILNAIKTGEELLVFTKARSRLPQDVDRVDLDSFLNGRHGTNAPTRALASLKWLNNQGQFGWPVQDLHIPAPSNPRKKRGQALVITPPMLTFLEEQAEAMWVAGDEHWTCLLGNWMVAAGCMRYKHLLRSEPRRISLSTFHAFCGRGKQRDNRKGFYWALPGHFASGFPWAKHWLTTFSALSETQRQNCGLCFDNNGEPWAMSEIIAQAQIQFKDHVPDATALTTYSFRRWGPTLGQLLKLSPVELNALGDWQNKGEAPKAAAMPLHYSAAKYTESVRVKRLVLGSLHFVCDFEAWEVIPASELLEAAKLGRQAVDQAISRDSQTVWTVPLSADDVKDQLRVSGELVEKAQALKSKSANSAAVRAMPSSIQGKVLSAYMKNGVALCGSYQVKKCELPESQCSGAHKCSVLLKQVRVCGGRHPACECQDRRAMLVEKMPVPEAQSPRPAPARPSRPIPALHGGQGGVSPKPAAKKGPIPKRRSPSAAPAAVLPVEQEEDPPLRGKRKREASVEAKRGDQYFDRLATSRGKTAQAPTKVFQHPSGGALWLSGLPIVSSLQHFPAVSVQLKCFAEPLEKRGGVQLPDAQLFTVSVADAAARDGEWRSAWPVLRQSIFQGESVICHCMAGRHRAAGIAILAKALLEGSSMADSCAAVSSMRDVEFHKLTKDKGVREWIHHAFRTSYVGEPLPRALGYMCTGRSKVHIRVEGDRPLCSHKQSAGRASERLVSPMFTDDLHEGHGEDRCAKVAWPKRPLRCNCRSGSCSCLAGRQRCSRRKRKHHPSDGGRWERVSSTAFLFHSFACYRFVFSIPFFRVTGG